MTTPPFGSVLCPMCKGKGMTIHLKMPCPNCKGAGWIKPKEGK